MEPKETFEITVRGDGLAFAAAHFLTYGGGQCEALHGHNYRVAVTVRGELDEHGLVLDFLVLREAIEGLLSPLDHRTLLPGRSTHMTFAEEGDVMAVTTPDRHMTFPSGDVVVLPISNTSAELLASHLARELQRRLDEAGVPKPAEIVVEVEESPGLTGRCGLRPGA
jgi:6-pyruvoyltetrahydropterin/6-carboxytetrahydropterin synthase